MSRSLSGVTQTFLGGILIGLPVMGTYEEGEAFRSSFRLGFEAKLRQVPRCNSRCKILSNEDENSSLAPIS
jgi:hypothetical protein